MDFRPRGKSRRLLSTGQVFFWLKFIYHKRSNDGGTIEGMVVKLFVQVARSRIIIIINIIIFIIIMFLLISKINIDILLLNDPWKTFFEGKSFKFKYTHIVCGNVCVELWLYLCAFLTMC